MIIELPWPPKELAPNVTVKTHWTKKGEIAKKHKNVCLWTLREALGHAKPILPPEGPLEVRITFYEPDRRKRDMDGLLSQNKHSLDAVAEYLGVDDYRFELILKRGGVVKYGKVVLEIGE